MDKRYTLKIDPKVGAKVKVMAKTERRGVAAVAERLIESGIKAEKIK